MRNCEKSQEVVCKAASAEAWIAYLEALSPKEEAVMNAKAAQFKQAVADTKWIRSCIWSLAEWAKTRQLSLPPLSTPLSVLSLVILSEITTTPVEKADAVKAYFITSMLDADLSNIGDASYSPEISSLMSVTEEEISSASKML